MAKSKQARPARMIGLWAVFVFCLVVVSISLISVVYPALIVTSVSPTQSLEGLGITKTADPFEAGVWVGPLFAANIIVLVLTLLYFKKRLPAGLASLFERLFSFEVSKRTAFVAVIMILAVYVGFTASELGEEEKWLDYKDVKQKLETWTPDQATTLSEPHVRYLLLYTSMKLFGNYAVVQFIGSIALVVTTYLITAEIAKKRFAGVIAMLILLQSTVFVTYDTSVAYGNFWILFYLLSLYLVIKAWPLSPLSYLLSIPSKALTAMFLPMSVYFVYRSDISKKKKIALLVTYTGIGIAGIATLSATNTNIPGSEIVPTNLGFWQGFTSMAFQMRFDGLVILFLLPLVVGLFLAARRGVRYSDAILVLIGGFLLIPPLLTGLTNMTNQPYRFIPLVVFFAMGVGVLLSKSKGDE